MSFDLALNKGDISIGSDGDLKKVRDTPKAIQDVLKILHSPVGSNPFFPQIGNSLTIQNIGENINREFAETKATASIQKSLQLLQAIQARQETLQVVTAGEKIIGIIDISAEQDPTEPRQFNIKVTVITGDQTIVDLPSFSLKTTID